MAGAPFSHLTGDLRMLGETFLWRVILQTHTVCRVSEINTHPRTHICWITLGVSSHKHKSGNHLRNYSSSVQRAARQAGVDNTAAAYRLLPPLLLTPPHALRNTFLPSSTSFVSLFLLRLVSCNFTTCALCLKLQISESLPGGKGLCGENMTTNRR